MSYSTYDYWYFTNTQALVREQQSAEQVQKLQEAINALIDEAGVRTREEVNKMYFSLLAIVFHLSA